MRRVVSLRRKILALGVAPPALLAIGIMSMLVFEGRRLSTLVASQTGGLVREQLGRTVRDAQLLCEASHTEVLRLVKRNLSVARDVLSRAGAVSFAHEAVAWRAVNLKATAQRG